MGSDSLTRKQNEYNLLRSLGNSPEVADEAVQMESDKGLALEVSDTFDSANTDRQAAVMHALAELMDPDQAPDPGTIEYANRVLLVARAAAALGMSTTPGAKV